jgi:hypothetical protein
MFPGKAVVSTQVKYLTGAPLLGKLLALPTNITQGWKHLPGDKHSSISVNYGRKKFYSTGANVIKLVTAVTIS